MLRIILVFFCFVAATVIVVVTLTRSSHVNSKVYRSMLHRGTYKRLRALCHSDKGKIRSMILCDFLLGTLIICFPSAQTTTAAVQVTERIQAD
jgi:hypothetical protein